jgi:hypothetical protein
MSCDGRESSSSDKEKIMASAVMNRVTYDMKNKNHKAKSLEGISLPRTFFNPKDPHDLAVYDVFRKSGKWIRHFYVEEPYLDVPTTIQQKLLDDVLSNIETLSKTLAELHEVKM